MNNDKQNRGFWKSLKDKGYYIALILCAAAIGISGYVYYRSNQSKTPDSLAGTGTAPSVTGQTATTPAGANGEEDDFCLLYTSPSPRDRQKSRMPSSA